MSAAVTHVVNLILGLDLAEHDPLVLKHLQALFQELTKTLGGRRARHRLLTSPKSMKKPSEKQVINPHTDVGPCLTDTWELFTCGLT